jgi:hypothetical protein
MSIRWNLNKNQFKLQVVMQQNRNNTIGTRRGHWGLLQGTVFTTVNQSVSKVTLGLEPSTPLLPLEEKSKNNLEMQMRAAASWIISRKTHLKSSLNLLFKKVDLLERKVVYRVRYAYTGWVSGRTRQLNWPSGNKGANFRRSTGSARKWIETKYENIDLTGGWG